MYSLDFEHWCEQSVIADCLRDVGLPNIANKMMKSTANPMIFDHYLSIIKTQAKRINDIDVINRLAQRGLLSKGELV
jgi:hypothetical protein